MEKFNNLRNGWITLLKTLKTMSTQDLYFLLEPDNDSKFFESVDSFKDCMEGTQFPDFQMLAIEYLLEYKKQNKLKITTVPYNVYATRLTNINTIHNITIIVHIYQKA